MVTAGASPAWRTRWMSAAVNVNASPAPNTRVTGSPPPAPGQAILGHAALDHRHGAGGQVVVVEAGVVIVHPADQPDRKAVVAVQLLVVPALRVVAHAVRPRGGVGGEAADDGLELGRGQLGHRKRSGLATAIACSAASPSPCGTGAATGRSEPYSSRS